MFEFSISDPFLGQQQAIHQPIYQAEKLRKCSNTSLNGSFFGLKVYCFWADYQLFHLENATERVRERTYLSYASTPPDFLISRNQNMIYWR